MTIPELLLIVSLMAQPENPSDPPRPSGGELDYITEHSGVEQRRRAADAVRQIQTQLDFMEAELIRPGITPAQSAAIEKDIAETQQRLDAARQALATLN